MSSFRCSPVVTTLALVMAAFVPLPVAALDLAAVARHARPAIVALEISDLDEKPIASGTGFVVGSDGLILTSRHVIEHGARATASFSDGRRIAVRYLVAEDSAHDLALLQLETISHLPALLLGGEKEHVRGADVAVVGYSFGLGEMWSCGVVKGMPELFGQRMVEFTAAISSGVSGAPLLNQDGQVVGVVQGHFVEPGSSFAIPVDAVRDLLRQSSKKMGVTVAAIPASATPTLR